MPYVFAIFDDDSDLNEAIRELEGAGMGEDIARVIDSAAKAADDSPGVPLVAGGVIGAPHTSQPQAVPVAIGAFNWRSAYSLGEEESDYLQGAVRDGASLLVLDTERPEDAESTLGRTAAQRVFSK